STVEQSTGSLTYRGYPAQELARSCSFEQVAYLIWHGELPDTAQLPAFCELERSRRFLDKGLTTLLDLLPHDSHPMDVLRTAVSYLGSINRESQQHTYDIAVELLAKLPTVVAALHRQRHGLAAIAPDTTLPFTENFFHMCFGSAPESRVLRCFETSMTLYAEHSFNASTFTARVVASTLSDTYSAVTAAIGALKGPLHGGANEAVMHTLTEIGSPGNVAAWVSGTLADKGTIMGFGHRVYKNGDSRVPAMAAAMVKLPPKPDTDKLLATYHELQRQVWQHKQLHPNLDFPSGLAYHLMGFDTALFTPMFVMSRITGWAAHISEQRSANSLIRPLGHYTGVPQRQLPVKRSRGAQ
ncbi:MAG: bifunctional 2-methylcitrate synthase/citrate synthase, partial [Mycobacteriales bacterium]